MKLYGTLRQKYPGYDHSRGLEVDIPEGSSVRKLLLSLGIKEPKGIVVISEGRPLKLEHILDDGFGVEVFQSVRGG